MFAGSGAVVNMPTEPARFFGAARPETAQDASTSQYSFAHATAARSADTQEALEVRRLVRALADLVDQPPHHWHEVRPPHAHLIMARHAHGQCALPV